MLTAARAVFSDTSCFRASLDDVAAKAGVARATVYYQFKSKFGLLEARFRRGSLTPEAFEQGLKEAAPLSKEQETAAGAMRVDLEVRGILATVTRERPTQIAAGKRFLEMKRAGRIPQGDEEVQPFWILMMGVADDQKDADLFAEGVDALKARFGGKPGAEKFFAQAEKKLAELRAAKP